MSILGDELRRLAVGVAVDVHAGGYSQETGTRLRREILATADVADDAFDSVAVIEFVAMAQELARQSPGEHVTITLIDHAPPPTNGHDFTPTPIPIATGDEMDVRRQRRRERAGSSRVSVQIGSRPAITSDVAFGPAELGLLHQGLRGQH